MSRIALELGALYARIPAEWISAALVGLALLVAVFAHAIAWRLLKRVLRGQEGVPRAMLERARRPARLAFVLAALTAVLPVSGVPPEWAVVLQHAALVLIIVIAGWTTIILVNYLSDRAMRRYRLDTDDNLQARKYVTQTRVLRRTANILLFLVTLAAVLMTFDGVQRYGVSLFASAGAAGLVLGFAARPVLANLIAGIQIALTQPIRIDDVVIVEDEWGWIEEIGATYVVVRLWDWRRMIVPLSFFIEQPFQNWTRESASIIGAVTWHADYTLPVAEMRAKLEELVGASPYWDGQVVNLQVTDASPETMQLRGLMSARTSPQAWDLRCEIREKMLSWLQEAHPGALPRTRAELRMEAGDREPAAAGPVQELWQSGREV